MREQDKSELRGFLENWPASPEAAAVLLSRSVQMAFASGIDLPEIIESVKELWDVHATLGRLEARVSSLERRHSTGDSGG